MDHKTNNEKPSSKEGGEMKVGDKVWVLCEVAMVYNRSLYMDIRHDSAVFEAKLSDCRPVEPSIKEPTSGQKIAERTLKAIWAANDAVNRAPAVEVCTKTANDQLRQSLMDYPFGEPANCPEIPDSSSEPIQVGDAVRFVWPGHKWHRTEGAIISTMGDPSIFVDIKEYPYRFKSDCGSFERWCSVDQLERIDKADPINPSHYKQGGIECIEAIKAALGEGFHDYLRGNVMKYLWRYKEKGGVNDLKKARWYLDRLIQEVGE